MPKITACGIRSNQSPVSCSEPFRLKPQLEKGPVNIERGVVVVARCLAIIMQGRWSAAALLGTEWITVTEV